ncbi:MAG: right-handed parallel beta-helix repeat-containing protein [Lentisphaerae bacterium]|nr:right-handed parallel beta-helix repeat-containing protein [Lentisphaerota bacterium]
MTNRCKRWVMAVGVAALTGARLAPAAVVYVDAGLAGSGHATDGLSWDTPWVDLQSALGAVLGGDAIWVARGVYKPGLSTNDAFVLPAGCQLYGGFTNGMATLDARDPRKYLTVLSGDLGGNDGTDFANRADNALNVIRCAGGITRSGIRLDGFVIRGGNANGAGAPNDTGGGGHFDLCHGLTIAHCTFTDNSGKGSGAIRLRRSNNVEIQDCIFSGNRATDATSNFGSGAIGGSDQFFNNAGYPAIVRRCIFTGNTSAGLAGVTYDSSAAWNISFINCLMAGNTALSNGGALYLRGGTNAMVNCTIALNDPLGVTTRLTTNIAVNTIIWSNGPGGVASPDVDHQNGGVLAASFSDLNHGAYMGIRGTIMADPKWGAGTQATWSAAGVYDAVVGQTRLRRATAAWATDAFQGMTVNPDLTQKRQFLISSNTATELYVWGDAQWMAAAGDTFRIWDFRLGNGSPCIDTATNGIVSDDVILTPRPKGFATDMGAYESVATGTVAGVIYVKASATGGNNGSAWEHAYTDLRSALATASGDQQNQIWVAAGTYRPGIGAAATFLLPTRVPIYGGFAGTEVSLQQRNIGANPTILSGDGDNNDTAAFANRANNATHVISDLYTKSVRLDGFIIRGGNATGAGVGGYGGGLYSEGSTNLVMANCVFVDNSAVGGGAVYINEPAPDWVTISDCVFSGNRATELDNDVGGGAITGAREVLASGYLLVERCVFTGNRAPQSIGGVYAMHNEYPLVSRFENCVVAGNQSGYTNDFDVTGPQGGAFYLRRTNAVVQNCTIGFNEPYGMTIRHLTASVQNTILWSNTARQILFLSPSAVSAQACDIDQDGYEGGNGNIRQDPLWGAGTNGVSAGIAYSPATGRSTLTVAGSPWVAGAFVNRAVNPNTAQNLQFWIITNSASQLTVWGDIQAVASVGSAFRVYDYHLTAASPCIDRGASLGAPGVDVERALRPVGPYLDIGAYEFGGPDYRPRPVWGMTVIVR